jgi:hypothetical protein
MKITMKRSWWLLCLPLGLMCLLSACVDRNYDIDDLDSTIKVDTELVAPLAYSKLKINDLLTDSLSGMQLVVEGEEMYLLYTDSQYMGNELIDQLKVLPKGKSEFQLLAGEDLPGTLITSGEISQDYTIEFSDLNTNPNERLDSILFDDCLVDVAIDVTMPLADDSYIDFIFPEEVLSLDKTLYPDNTMRVPITQAHTEASLSLYKAMLRLNGSNQVKINVHGYIYASEPFQSGDKIDVTIDFNHVMPHLTYMNIGTARDIYEGEKIIDFNYTSDFQQEDAFFPFFDPQIKMSCINNIGVPVRYFIDYVEAIDTRTGEKVRADFGGPNPDTTSMVVKTPSYDEIKGLSHDELMNFDLSSIICQSDTVFDREFGHTDRLFKINPNKLKYHYRIRSVDNNKENVHYFFQQSDMVLKENTKLPLWFEGAEDPSKNFYITRLDTVAFMNEPADVDMLDFTPETECVLHLSYTNFLPVGVQGTLSYLGYDNQPVMPEANQSFKIVAGKVDATGYVQESTIEENSIHIQYQYDEALRLFKEVKSLVFTYKMANDELKTVRLRTSDWLELKANVYLNGALIISFNEGEDK